MQALDILLLDPNLASPLKAIAQKVKDNERITFEDGIYLYKNAELGYLGCWQIMLEKKSTVI